MKPRAAIIRIIEQLYPADAPWDDTVAIGRKLLAEAKAMAWRSESDEVLINYARLCEEYGAEEDSPPNEG